MTVILRALSYFAFCMDIKHRNRQCSAQSTNSSDHHIISSTQRVILLAPTMICFLSWRYDSSLISCQLHSLHPCVLLYLYLRFFLLSSQLSPPTHPRSAASFPLGMQIRGQGCVSLCGKLYVFGGWIEGGPSTRRVDCYDPRTHRWSRKSDMLTSRTYHAYSVVDGCLYVAGGLIRPRFSIHEVLSSMEVYDPLLDRWQVAPSMPEPLLHTRAASHNHLLYVCGFREQNELVTHCTMCLNARWQARRGQRGRIQSAEIIGWTPGRVLSVGLKLLGFVLQAGQVYDTRTGTWRCKSGMSGPFFATINGCLARVGSDGVRKQIQVRLQVGPNLKPFRTDRQTDFAILHYLRSSFVAVGEGS